MKRILKRVALVSGAVLVTAVAAIGIYALVQTSAFDASVSKVYDVPIPTIARSTDPVVIARGKHLAESIASCATRSCHGDDLGGGKVSKLGPVATLAPPNITSANLGAAYTDGELARLIRHGIKKDGRSLLVMPMQEIDWLPDDDLVAVISYVRSVPPVERPNGTTTVSALGKVFDRRGQAVFDIARAIDHERPEHAPPRAPTA